MLSTDDIQTSFERHRQARLKAETTNEKTVLAALKAAAIEFVTVEFDAGDDRGQIDKITSTTAGSECTVLEISVPILKVDCGCDALNVTMQTLYEAIETVCYDFLEQQPGGCEDPHGACGKVLFDVTWGSIEMEFDGQYVETYIS